MVLFIQLMFLPVCYLSAEIPEKISVAVFDGVDPVVFTDKNGKASGFFPEMLEYIFEKNNLEIEFIQGISFQDAYTRVLAGDIDILPGIKFSSLRSEFFDFNSESFIVSWSQVFVVPDSPVETVFDLRDKKVALMNDDQNGRNFIRLMADFDILFTPLFFSDLDEMNRELLDNHVDAMISFNFYAKSNQRLKATEIVFSPTRSLVASKKGKNRDILDLIDREISDMKNDRNSFYYRLLEKWLFPGSFRSIPSWVYAVFAVATASLLTTFLFIYLLKSRVEKIRKQLFKSEEFYRAVFNGANDSIFLTVIKDRSYGLFTDANRTACEKFGYSRDDLLALSLYDMVPEDEKEKVGSYREKLLNEGSVIFKTIYLTGEGKSIPVEVNSRIIELNNVNYVMSVVRDLSYREEFDSILSAMEMKYRTIAEYNYDWEFWQTPEREFIYSSPSCLRISGYSAEEFMQDTNLFYSIVYHEDSTLWENFCCNTVCGDSNRNSFEFRIIRKDESVIWVDLQCRKIFDSEGSFIGFRGSIRDIDQRKSMEQQLKRKQKLESIGVLAGGVAHDFNNILSIIRGYAELGQMESSVEEETRDKFDIILQAANRGINLTGQILDFARDKRNETKTVNVSSLAEEVFRFIKPSFPRSINVSLSSDADVLILADEGQLHQIFMNICTNARLAMPDGGELAIRIRKTGRGNSGIFPEDPETEAVEISFCDTGCGMSEEIRERVFDPFFTTREAGKGSGMGMSVVHGLVKQWGGHILLESEEGKGTCVYLYFKIHGTISEEDDGKTEEEKVRKMSNIIVFDDENMILDLIGKFLTREGHSVLLFSDVLKGLEYFKNNHSKFDLVITDMTMPDLSGDALAVEIKKINSSVPVLLSSGYSDRFSSDMLPEAVNEIIKKPFTGKELVSAVNSLLK